ncbi:MAG: DUF4037 domain-containing protein [Lachnospiraceae bacterium]|jgi:hypothetical protein|nr:DUF4037 domain-containing protein [Lachnospiraceae bacterium]
MKGLKLSEQFFEEELYPLLKESKEELLYHGAFGLVGPGSECLGFDDETSWDHDFTPLCCIWVRREDMDAYGSRFRELLGRLPKEYRGFPLMPSGGLTSGRRGVLELERFYYSFLGCEGIPQSLADWSRIPEAFLATAVNGAVFLDLEGSFTRMRESLLAYYPQDIWLHRMAYCCTKIAQAGQYNYPRCIKRGEWTAASLAKGEFLEYAIRLLYLLNRKYCPFYKWMHRGLGELPLFGHEGQRRSNELVREADGHAAAEKIEDWCESLFFAMDQVLNLSPGSGFFLEYAQELQGRIENEAYRKRGAWAES